MSRVQTVLGTGYSASAPTETQLVMSKIGYTPSAGAPLVVSSHTAGLPASYEPIGTTVDSFRALYRDDIVDSGYQLVSGDEALTNMGNDTGISRVTDLVTYGRANGGWNKKPIYVGASMGGLLSLNATLAAVQSRSVGGAVPVLPVGMLLFVPVTNLQALWQNATFTAAVNAAYGGAYNDATMGAQHNPATFGASLAGIPTMIVYDLDDTTTIIPAWQTALQALIGSSCTLVGVHGGGSHGSETEFAAIRAVRSTYVNFLDGLKPAA